MVTIREVAKIAEVSMTTVSRAYNPKSVIKESTREKILKIANDIGYIPNLSARGLVTNKKFVIGIFLSRIHTDMSIYLSDILSNIHDSLPDNYLLSIEGIDRVTSFDQNVKNRFDGILIVSQTTDDNQFIYQAKNSELPLVVILRQTDDLEINNIYSDDEQGVRSAVDYVSNNGHKKIGMINGTSNFIASIKRHHGVEQGCIDNGLNLVKEADLNGDFSSEAGQKLMNKIIDLSDETRPTCIFCANDDTALGALKACNIRGVKVPEDMSIIGFDNINYGKFSTPSLTTIDNPIKKMATKGIKRLISLINGEDIVENLTVIESSKFIVRDSVGNIN